jgi:hypothetical protein
LLPLLLVPDRRRSRGDRGSVEEEARASSMRGGRRTAAAAAARGLHLFHVNKVGRGCQSNSWERPLYVHTTTLSPAAAAAAADRRHKPAD